MAKKNKRKNLDKNKKTDDSVNKPKNLFHFPEEEKRKGWGI